MLALDTSVSLKAAVVEQSEDAGPDFEEDEELGDDDEDFEDDDADDTEDDPYEEYDDSADEVERRHHPRREDWDG